MLEIVKTAINRKQRGREMMLIRRCLGPLVAALSLVALVMPASSQDSRPITILYPGAAGGAVEVTLRAISDAASKILGRPIVVDARGGANGRIAFNAMAQSSPSQLTLLFASNANLVFNPLIDKVALEP